MNREFVTLKKEKGRLKIALTDAGRGFLASHDDNPDTEEAMYLLLESHLCDGWEFIKPEEVGALSGCDLIITDECNRSEDGEEILKLGRVYWHPNYMVEDPVDILRERRRFFLTEAEEV